MAIETIEDNYNNNSVLLIGALMLHDAIKSYINSGNTNSRKLQEFKEEIQEYLTDINNAGDIKPFDDEEGKILTKEETLAQLNENLEIINSLLSSSRGGKRKQTKRRKSKKIHYRRKMRKTLKRRRRY
jgi:hypothetical protein